MKKRYIYPTSDEIEMISTQILQISNTEISEEEADGFDLPEKREFECPIWID